MFQTVNNLNLAEQKSINSEICHHVSLMVFTSLRCIRTRPGGLCKVRIFVFLLVATGDYFLKVIRAKFTLKYFRHAKRSTVSIEDVKLVARRSTALVS